MQKYVHVNYTDKMMLFTQMYWKRKNKYYPDLHFLQRYLFI